MRPLLALLVVAGVAACGSEVKESKSPSPPGPTCGSHLITGNAIGELKIGIGLDSLKTRCSLGRDTTVPGPEGMSQRQVVARYETDSAIAEIVDGRVWRISVTSPAFYTSDSIRVGSKLAQFPGYPELRSGFGEGKLFLFVESSCGLSFQVDTASVSAALRANSRVSQIVKRLSADATVARILVTGCS